jgi:hypothetical protein
MPEIDLEITNSTHWSVQFEVLLDKSKALIDDKEVLETLESSEFWMEDAIVVAGTEDATSVIAQVKNYVLNTDPADEEYPLPVIGFRLTGIERLSVAEL